MIFPWSLSDSQSPQISRPLLSILADINNAVVWIVSVCPLISKCSFGDSTNYIWYHRHFHVSIFFSSLARSMYLSLFSPSSSSSSSSFCEFLTPASAEGLLLESKRPQVSSGLQDSPWYSSRPQRCWSPFVCRFTTPSALLLSFWGSFQVHQLQLASPSPSCSIAFFVLRQDLSIDFFFFDFHSVVSRDRQLNFSESSLFFFLFFFFSFFFFFLLIITKSGIVAGIRWSVSIAKS